MATNYPGSLDSWNNPTSTTAMDASGYEHHLAHANIYDAIEAIEGELGTNPSGTFSTVSRRISDDTSLNSAWPIDNTWIHGVSNNGVNQTLTLASNTLYYDPFYIPATGLTSDITFTGIKIEVVTTATANVRLGLYTSIYDSGLKSYAPYQRVFDAGTVSTSTTGYKSIAISQSLNRGALYWTAYLADGTPGLRARVPYSSYTQTSSNSASFYGWSEGFAYGALPSVPNDLSLGTVIRSNANTVWLEVDSSGY